MKKAFKLGCGGFLALIILIVIIAVFSDGETSEVDSDTKVEATTEPKENAADTKEEPKEEAKEDNVPREYKSALKKAEMYAETMQMSKAGIYDQLISEYGEGFPKEAAQYAIDNLEFDWKANALEKAKSYAETMAMSDTAIYDQLISEYGEKFTAEEAQYAIDHLE
ncbi:Ltp family lipoprotein [Solibacillus isronensis]|uniref:Ltp family lipoprotein n=1 Tax=Solibacillus isronensis TaxID=412383 RepID=UPI0020403ECE|nr:Ltp family lipoprotein [Solibacillus isronensis]MCM3721393.1 Ltp family lipoprotein [Solibacillus isronensis]